LFASSLGSGKWLIAKIAIAIWNAIAIPIWAASLYMLASDSQV
jgi:hypothetical protein